MKPINRYMLKMLVLMFISSTLLWMVSSYFFLEPKGLKLIGSIVFGAFFSISSLFYYNYVISDSYDKNPNELQLEDLKPRQKRYIKSKLTLFEVKRKLLDSPYFKAKKISFKDERLRFKKRLSAYSWGEYISVKQAVFNADEEYTYEITSRPVFPLQWFDYGTNYKNIKELEKLIN